MSDGQQEQGQAQGQASLKARDPISNVLDRFTPTPRQAGVTTMLVLAWALGATSCGHKEPSQSLTEADNAMQEVAIDQLRRDLAELKSHLDKQQEEPAESPASENLPQAQSEVTQNATSAAFPADQSKAEPVAEAAPAPSEPPPEKDNGHKDSETGKAIDAFIDRANHHIAQMSDRTYDAAKDSLNFWIACITALVIAMLAGTAFLISATMMNLTRLIECILKKFIPEKKSAAK